MEDTIRKLPELGIQTVGGGMNIHEARKPASIEKNGLRVACLQYNTIGPRESWASPLKAGSAFIEDTINKLRELGIRTAGGGMNICEARQPARLEKNRIRTAFLQYNAVGPRESWAFPLKAGSAFIRVETHYVNDKANPGGLPSSIYTVVDPATLHDMEQDIRQAKLTSDIVIVGVHMGLLGAPVILQYQTEISRRAIDAGAEMVLACHAHALVGIEMYKGKPIYHGLGNFVTVTNAFAPDSPNSVQRAYQPFHALSTIPYLPVKPSGGLKTGIPYYPFSEESRNTIIAKCILNKEGLLEARFIPCFINDQAQPVPVRRDQGGQQVLAEAGYPNGFETTITTTTSPEDVAISTAIQAYLEQVGIKAKVNQVDGGGYTQAITSTWDGLILFLARADADLGTVMPRYLAQSATLFSKGIIHPDNVERLFKDVAAAPDEAGKKQRACELQRAVFEEHALFTPLYVSMQQAVKQPYVVNDGINVANATSWTPEEVRIQK